MASAAEFVRPLLREGTVILRDRPEPPSARDGDVLELLQSAFTDYRLQVAGPEIPFDRGTAVAAVGVVGQACWFLLSRGEPDVEVERCLAMPAPPRSPGQHLSADLLLRYLAQVHRRARAQQPSDVLTTALARLLQEWPLSGVLSDVQEGPLTPPDFGDHPGLRLLYAERLQQNHKAAWLPDEKGQEYLALVEQASGRVREPRG